MRRFLCTTLMHNGFEALEAADGAQALSTLRAQLPNLVLLDLVCPDIDGIEVLTLLREQTGAVIVISARLYTEAREGRSLDIARTLRHKPFARRSC